MRLNNTLSIIFCFLFIPGFTQNKEFNEKELFSSSKIFHWDDVILGNDYYYALTHPAYQVSCRVRHVPFSKKGKLTNYKIKKVKNISCLYPYKENAIFLANLTQGYDQASAEVVLREINQSGVTVNEYPIFSIEDNEVVRGGSPLNRNKTYTPFKGELISSKNEEFHLVIISKGYWTEKINNVYGGLTMGILFEALKESRELIYYAILDKNFKVIKSGNYEDRFKRRNLVNIEGHISNNGSFHILYNYCHRKEDNQAFPIKLLTGDISDEKEFETHEYTIEGHSSAGFKPFWNGDSLELLGYTTKKEELTIDGVFSFSIDLNSYDNSTINLIKFNDNHKELFNSTLLEKDDFISNLHFDIEKDNNGVYYFVQRSCSSSSFTDDKRTVGAMTVFQMENYVIKKLAKISNLKHNLYSSDAKFLKYNGNLYIITNQYGKTVNKAFYQFSVPVFIKVNDNSSYSYSEKSLILTSNYRRFYIKYAWKYSADNESIIVGMSNDRNDDKIQIFSFPLKNLLD